MLPLQKKKVYACTLQQKRYVLSEDPLQAKNKKQDMLGYVHVLLDVYSVPRKPNRNI
jgi:hypothetical protein